jgi:hypothetical protein
MATWGRETACLQLTGHLSCPLHRLAWNPAGEDCELCAVFESHPSKCRASDPFLPITLALLRVPEDVI